jgi:hypothetical protein
MGTTPSYRGQPPCSLHLLHLGLALALAAAPHLVSRAGLPALPVLLMQPSLCVLKSLHSENKATVLALCAALDDD